MIYHGSFVSCPCGELFFVAIGTGHDALQCPGCGEWFAVKSTDNGYETLKAKPVVFEDAECEIETNLGRSSLMNCRCVFVPIEEDDKGPDV